MLLKWKNLLNSAGRKSGHLAHLTTIEHGRFKPLVDVFQNLVHLIVASLISSEIYRWETGKFTKIWSGGSARDLYPFAVDQSSGSLLIAVEVPFNESQPVNIWQMSMIGNSDFVPRLLLGFNFFYL